MKIDNFIRNKQDEQTEKKIKETREQQRKGGNKTQTIKQTRNKLNKSNQTKQIHLPKNKNNKQ